MEMNTDQKDTVTMCNPNQSIPNMTVAKLTADMTNIRVDSVKLHKYATFSRSHFKPSYSDFLIMESICIRMIEKIPTTYLKMLNQAICWW
jgi:hypothetical protein